MDVKMAVVGDEPIPVAGGGRATLCRYDGERFLPDGERIEVINGLNAAVREGSYVRLAYARPEPDEEGCWVVVTAEC